MSQHEYDKISDGQQVDKIQISSRDGSSARMSSERMQKID